MSAGYYRLGQYYLDTNAMALYRCTTAGTKYTAVWTKITGGSSIAPVIYDSTQPYSPGAVVRINVAQTIGGVACVAATFMCAVATTANPSSGSGNGNMIPQFPEPTSGTLYWFFLGFVPQSMGICNASGSQSVYVQASGSFGV